MRFVLTNTLRQVLAGHMPLALWLRLAAIGRSDSVIFTIWSPYTGYSTGAQVALTIEIG